MGRLSRRLAQRWQDFRRSLLYYPVVGLMLAIVLFALTSWVDRSIQNLVLAMEPTHLGFLVFSGNPEASRSVLSAIATMWATITGVVYSVTLVTVQLSATKYTVEAIPQFEKDRVNRVVLALYTATVAYALLVLKTVRVEADSPFAPLLGVNVAVVLALVALFALGVFISNLVQYMRPKRFVDDLSGSTMSAARSGYEQPDKVGARPLTEPPRFPRDALETGIRAQTEGFTATVHYDRIAKAANALPEGTVVRLTKRAGSRIEKEDVLVEVALPTYPKSQEGNVLKALQRLQGAIDVASERTLEGDPHFGIETLGDIGVTTTQSPTDIAITKRCVDGLLRVGIWEAGRERPPCGMEINGVKVDLRQEPLLGHALKQVKQVYDTALGKGLWILTETVCERTADLLARLDEEERHNRFRDALEFLEAILTRAFAMVQDDAALARAVDALKRTEGSLRDKQRHEASRAIHMAVEEAAAQARRETGKPLGPRTTLALERAPAGA